MADRNKIFEIRVGSHLFGTSTPESDEDYFGVFMPGPELLYGFQRCERWTWGSWPRMRRGATPRTRWTGSFTRASGGPTI
jgi:hypothetical protein